MSKFSCEVCFTMNRICDSPLWGVNINVLQMETFMCVSCKPVTVNCPDVNFPGKEGKVDNEQCRMSCLFVLHSFVEVFRAIKTLSTY